MNLALFDFDGTITHTDTFTQFMLYAVPKNRLRLGKLVLLPTLIKYKLGVEKGRDIRAKILHFAFKGVDEYRLQAKGQAYAYHILPKFLRPSAMQRLQWHKDRGDTVVIVSASLNIYLKPWCEGHGLKLICTEVDTKNGIVTGFSKQGDCSSERKQQLVMSQYNMDDFDSVYAYGDTVEDNELLAMASSDDKRFYQYFD
ncbi:HAD-IB family hydrolase [Psychrobacter lutiphocae]|uniref:HAD-IB family hydrolase n=1 Tax=Psychrobacter lutiphocae TaxID=540500 RepID=UPI00037FDB13|nr:HAD-IB family hydrolase [Psychrobacter lutiphocae]